MLAYRNLILAMAFFAAAGAVGESDDTSPPRHGGQSSDVSATPTPTPTPEGQGAPDTQSPTPTATPTPAPPAGGPRSANDRDAGGATALDAEAQRQRREANEREIAALLARLGNFLPGGATGPVDAAPVPPIRTGSNGSSPLGIGSGAAPAPAPERALASPADGRQSAFNPPPTVPAPQTQAQSQQQVMARVYVGGRPYDSRELPPGAATQEWMTTYDRNHNVISHFPVTPGNMRRVGEGGSDGYTVVSDWARTNGQWIHSAGTTRVLSQPGNGGPPRR